MENQITLLHLGIGNASATLKPSFLNGQAFWQFPIEAFFLPKITALILSLILEDSLFLDIFFKLLIVPLVVRFGIYPPRHSDLLFFWFSEYYQVGKFRPRTFPRPYYSPEFKLEAVKIVESIGITKAATELGVNVNSLRTWTQRAKANGSTEMEKPSSVYGKWH